MFAAGELRRPDTALLPVAADVQSSFKATARVTPLSISPLAAFVYLLCSWPASGTVLIRMICPSDEKPAELVAIARIL